MITLNNTELVIKRKSLTINLRLKISKHRKHTRGGRRFGVELKKTCKGVEE